MKRLIAAVSFTLIAAPALAETGKPYEQLDVNRALPNIAEQPAGAVEYRFNGGAPYEQLLVDRGFTGSSVDRTQLASSGATRSDVEISSQDAVGTTTETAGWEDNHHFIAPPQ